jgi:hypothetical protein
VHPQVLSGVRVTQSLVLCICFVCSILYFYSNIWSSLKTTALTNYSDSETNKYLFFLLNDACLAEKHEVYMWYIQSSLFVLLPFFFNKTLHGKQKIEQHEPKHLS